MSKLKTVKQNNKTINAEKLGFAEFMAKQQLKNEELEVVKQERKVVRTRSEHFSLKNNVLLLILNSGINGITVAEIMASKPLQNKKDSYSIHTINRDWNVESEIQAEQINIQEKGVEVVFDIDTTEVKSPTLKGKNNNRISIMFGAENLKEYLLAHNCKDEYLK